MPVRMFFTVMDGRQPSSCAPRAGVYKCRVTVVCLYATQKGSSRLRALQADTAHTEKHGLYNAHVLAQ